MTRVPHREHHIARITQNKRSAASGRPRSEKAGGAVMAMSTCPMGCDGMRHDRRVQIGFKVILLCEV